MGRGQKALYRAYFLKVAQFGIVTLRRVML
jgi:hypothetical protein